MKPNIEVKHILSVELKYEEVKYLWALLKDPIDGETAKEKELREDIWGSMEYFRYNFENPM